MATCPECGKEFRNESGLFLHSRAHSKAKATDEPKAGAKGEAVKGEVKAEGVKEHKGDFILTATGDEGIVSDASGRPLTKTMPIDAARKIFDRWATSTR